MKRFLLTFLFIMSITIPVFATNVSVQINGEIINFTDENGARVDAQIINNRTMVPMRKIFEMLGATVEWNGDTRTVTATKDDTQIVLQINNDIATISKGDVTNKVVLDSKPIIVENRTLVPFRFVSESLDKQVGWDSDNRTAIIIDYDFFVDRIAEKTPLLYEAITSNGDITNVSLTREYNDLLDTTKNTTSTVNARISNISNDTKSVSLSFDGTSDLFQEIKSEGWSSISTDVKFDESEVSLFNVSDILNKMLSKKTRTYDELRLSGIYDDSLSDAIKKMVDVKDNEINIGTFEEIKSEFDNFMNLATITVGTATENIKFSNLNYRNSNNKYFDFTKFDNIIFDNDVIQVYNVINKFIFNYDVTLEELLYDTSSLDISCQLIKDDSGFSTDIVITAQTDFDELIVYSLRVS